jgi:hypothetical protein
MSNENDFFKKLSEQHPFITICHYSNQDYVGIIQNRDDVVTTMYDYGALVTPELRSKFLELGEIWWWESNRQIGIHLFLKDEWNSLFRPYIKTFNNKGLIIVHGPVVCMSEFNSARRSKRKSITLVKKI